MTRTEALERAVSIAGGQSDLERKLKELGRRAGQAAISLWMKAGRLPEGKDWGLWVARAVDHKITPNDLDPDAYPNPWDGIPLEIARERGLLQEAA